MNEKILTPVFSTEEPNMKTALKKNEDGLCCRDCNNKLSDPPDTAFYGLKVCKECRKELDEMCKRIDKECWDYWVQAVTDVVNTLDSNKKET